MHNGLNYLFTPVSKIFDLPPIDTKLHTLPIEELPWEDFEKLCLSIIQTQFSINDCEIYGTKGQAQGGIDIIAKQTNGRYSSYQCKRYQEYKVSDLDAAIKKFKEGKFHSQSDIFHLCVSCALDKTEFQDQFNAYEQEFKKEGIKFVKWDKTKLSNLLKEQPQIVYDFFGLEWVKKFNGKECIKQCSTTKKMDAQQVVAFRKELYTFYSTTFNVLDPGMLIEEIKDSNYSLQERYVIPDIFSYVKNEDILGDFSLKEEIPPQNRTDPTNEYLYHSSPFESSYTDSIQYFRNMQNVPIEHTKDVELRIHVDDVLSGNKNTLVLGDPGAGKSTLLRFMTLDILSPHPILENTAKNFGKLLPIWLPFAFITKQINKKEEISIRELLLMWFHSYGKDDLYDIVQTALDDERLLLIIDGVDEWTNSSAAQHALDKINITVGLHNAHVLFSSRPYGFNRMKECFRNASILTLAPFSKEQQKEYISKWYTKKIVSSGKTNVKLVEEETRSFMDELRRTQDLFRLAENPLLLGILLLQKMKNAVLPKNKLIALQTITEYLINIHPAKRKKNAGIVDETSHDINFQDLFCELAMFMQKENNDGIISKEEACRVIADYLVTYADFNVSMARQKSKDFVDVGANQFGIIIEKSNKEISFAHRQFQEYLAGKFIADSDEKIVTEILQNHAGNLGFHQTILFFFELLPPKQIKRFTDCYEVISSITPPPIYADYLSHLCYEIAVTLNNTPSKIANSKYELLLHEFEYETFYPHKISLLKLILDTLSIGKFKERTLAFIAQYFPNQYAYRDYRINHLKNLKQLTATQVEFLKKSLINGSLYVKIDASNVLKEHILDDNIYRFLCQTIKECSNPEVLSFAINSLLSPHIDSQTIRELVESIEGEHNHLQLFQIKYKVFFNQHNEKDLDKLFALSEELTYVLEEEIINVFVDGFADSPQLKNKFFAELKDKENTKIFNRIHWKVLMHCLHKDEDVADLIAKEITEKEHPFSFTNGEVFSYINTYFQGKEKVMKACEEYVLRNVEKYEHIHLSVNVYYACLVARTDKIKELLLSDLEECYHSHWPVSILLTGWGDDPTVIKSLKRYFTEADTEKKLAAAAHISDVFADDKTTGLSLLDVFLNTPSSYKDRASMAYVKIDKKRFETTWLEKIIAGLDPSQKDSIFGDYYSIINLLITEFNHLEIIKRYFLEILVDDPIASSYILNYYPGETSNVEKILACSMPLTNDLRYQIIERFQEPDVINEQTIQFLSKFPLEAEPQIKATAAVFLFDHCKYADTEFVLQLSEPLVFARGFDYEIMRNIAFMGYLLIRKLPEYFLLRNDSKEQASPESLLEYENYNREATNEYIIKLLITNFDYLISIFGADLTLLKGRWVSDKNQQKIWGMLARYSEKSSPTCPYINEFITQNRKMVTEPELIKFLGRTSPRSALLKEILLLNIDKQPHYNQEFCGRLLGINYSEDKDVYEFLIHDLSYDDTGKIIALCIGWPKEPILKDFFQEITSEKPYWVSDDAGFYLKFLFRNVNNIMEFLETMMMNVNDSKRLHKHFFTPLVDRLQRDDELVAAIQQKLLEATTPSEKISYYNLVAKANYTDEDMKAWKEKQSCNKYIYGYDILSNKTIYLLETFYHFM